MNQSAKQNLLETFASQLGGAPEHLVRAPGRVNLIGEHTDYNDGFVLPMAIERETRIALRGRDDTTVRLYSIEQDDTCEFDLAALQKADCSWGEYPKGVAWALQEEGYPLRGWEGVSTCDVPMGAGLSSSASFELAVAYAFAGVSAFPWEAAKMALLCKRAENQWVGVNCGIMDQLISAIGRKDHSILIDCRTLGAEAVPLPAATSVVVMDTGTRRGLVDSAYNERRQQCEAAANFFGAKALRDVTSAQLETEGGRLDEVTLRRARHVTTENERTQRAATAMKAGDARELGELLNQSHTSMRDDFEICNAELDKMVELARAAPGCLGARMTGGGFGGCAVGLVRAANTAAFMTQVSESYRAATGRVAALYLCPAVAGAGPCAQ